MTRRTPAAVPDATPSADTPHPLMRGSWLPSGAQFRALWAVAAGVSVVTGMEHWERVPVAVPPLIPQEEVLAAEPSGIAVPPNHPRVLWAGWHGGAPWSVEFLSAFEGRLDVNTASAALIETLPRIGPALAREIVSYRLEHGPFHSPAELDAVRGIGLATIERVSPLLLPDTP